MAVVTVIARVEHTDGHWRALQPRQLGRQTASQVISLGQDADEDEAVDAAVALGDLVRDARERAANLVGIHHRGFEPAFGDAHERRRSRSAMRTCRPLRAWRQYATRGSSATSGE